MAGRKRNLALRLEACDSPYSPQAGNGSSPMTALSHIMVGLSCVGSTPRRKLSLEGGDTPKLPLSRNSSQSSGISVSSLDNEEIDDNALSAGLENADKEEVQRTKQALRRYNSVPSSFNSPLFPQAVQRSMSASSPDKLKKPLPLESPIEEDEIIFFSNNSTSETKYNDVQKYQPENSDSAHYTSIRRLPSDGFVKPRPVSAPASLLNQGKVQTRVPEDTVKLQPFDDDDGFCDIFDSDSQGAHAEGPEGFSGLLNNPIIKSTSQATSVPSLIETMVSPPLNPLQTLDCNAMDITPEPKCRRGIFKVPSQPAIRRNNSFLKRPDRPRDTPSPIMKKKSRSVSVASPNPEADVRRLAMQHKKKALFRSMSSSDAECHKRIERKLSRDDEGLNLTGDGSQGHLLPLINGSHKELKTITPETLARLIQKGYLEVVQEFFIVDARYPYEYKGGHIKGAINLYKRSDIEAFFLNHPMQTLDKRRIIVFHCEFSSQRAPSLYKYLREEDRNANLENYPDLFYPELYLLDGGYKNFFENCKELCEPQSYKPMLHKDHNEDLRHFKAKSKSWTGVSRLKLKDRFSKF